MAITSFTPDKAGEGSSPIAIAGGWWFIAGRLLFAGSYVSGGDTFDLTKFFPLSGTIREVVCLGTVRGLTPEYDVTNKKLKLFALNPAAASIDVAPLEHPAAALNALITVAGGVPIAFLVK